MNVIKEVFQNGEWLSADELAFHQMNRLQAESQLHGWKQRGLVFSVRYEGREYYARYQFDAAYQPLPVIKDILAAYGAYTDAWSVAAWFHFPNGWIANEEGDGVVPVPPKDALHRSGDVVRAACNRTGSYVA